MKRLLFAIALVTCSTPVAAEPAREIREIRADEQVTIRPDRAYLLVRRLRPEDTAEVEPILLRIPSAAEMERYRIAKEAAFRTAEPDLTRRRETLLRRRAEAQARGRTFRETIPPPPSVETFNFVYDEVHNVHRINMDRALVPGRPESVHLVEVPPGDYVLYGASYGNGFTNRPALYTCMCLGTVGFSAPAGVVTDLGYFMGDMVHRASRIPELAPESGFGPTMAPIFALLGATVRPVRPDTTVPASLGGAQVRAAEYRAIGKFFDPRAMGINRLVPVPGILGYDEGRVIDVRSGQPVPDRH